MKHLIPTLIIGFVFLACSSEKRLLRKASNAVDVYDYKKALGYYDQILAKDSDNFYGNAGKGIVLSEYMARYEESIPYLEKAAKKSPEKVTGKINNDLGRGYHHVGNYPKALEFYNKDRLYNKDRTDEEFDVYLTKRIADCRYAMTHTEVADPEHQSFKNAGPVINSEMSDFGPVYANNRLIYTSKRKDDENEKVNGVDHRYFESMYIASASKDAFSSPRRYTLPDRGSESKFKKGGESALSISPDDKTLYVLYGGNIYEADLSDSTKDETKMSSVINFGYLQRHACLSSDGKTLLFTSESEKGDGGSDIYMSTKKADGSWSDPVLLPPAINTKYNEDAPFLATDNTLYFSSNGLPGYGGYDVYRCKYVNGDWLAPENIGQPINTSGDDIYFTLKPNSSNGFYASNRPGGYGDMDIYMVHYIPYELPECNTRELITINALPTEKRDGTYDLYVTLDPAKSSLVRQVSWQVNRQMVVDTGASIKYSFREPNTYTISTRVVLYCDTCPYMLTACAEKELVIYPGDSTALSASQPLASETKESDRNKNVKSTLAEGRLNNDQLMMLGWDVTPAYFDYDKATLRENVENMLDRNIEVLKKNPGLIFVINGYADSRGSDAYNVALSHRRLMAVKSYMVKKGVSQRRIVTTHSYGEGKITNGCTDNIECDENKHQENRKVEFEVSNKAIRD
ncbi:MAG: OmpA family protein [Bacteroidia bacterium]|nr:OmpA family protein [Bacteroidia bacterium]